MTFTLYELNHQTPVMLYVQLTLARLFVTGNRDWEGHYDPPRMHGWWNAQRAADTIAHGGYHFDAFHFAS